MAAASAIVGALALGLNLVAVLALRRWVRWMYDQRRRGYPDERASRLDRRSVWIAVAAGWLWANMVMAVALALAGARLA